MSKTRWQALVSKHLRAVPKGASKQRRGQAMKDASREYRRGGRATNPTSSEWKWLMIGAVALLLAPKIMAGLPKPPTTPAP